jgi:hypothetical protein
MPWFVTAGPVDLLATPSPSNLASWLYRRIEEAWCCLLDALSGSSFPLAQMAAKRKREADLKDKPTDQLTPVELAPAGSRSHCAWCDLRIEPGTPTVGRQFYHAGGNYSRNHGESTGTCPKGQAVERLHPQCAFSLFHNARGSTAKPCGVCDEPVTDDWHIVSRMGAPGARCTPSRTSPLHLHTPCVAGYVRKHGALLRGHVGGAAMADEKVAWEEEQRSMQGSLADYFGKNKESVRPRYHGTPSDKLEEYRRVFTLEGVLGGGEAEAVVRHRALQGKISEALKKDKEVRREKEGVLGCK